MSLRVALIDDHRPYRERLRALLEEDRDIEIVAEAGSGHEILHIAQTTEMDAACMDVSMPGMNGIEATRRLLALRPGVRVIGLSAYADPHYVEAMLDAGAVGYFTKDDAGTALLQALHTATRERLSFGADISIPVAANAAAAPDRAAANGGAAPGTIAASAAAAPGRVAANAGAAPDRAAANAAAVPDQAAVNADTPSLGAKELEVLLLIAKGLASPQIARSLSMDPAMVDVYRRNMMRKLQVNNDAALVEYARRIGPGTA